MEIVDPSSESSDKDDDQGTESDGEGAEGVDLYICNELRADAKTFQAILQNKPIVSE